MALLGKITPQISLSQCPKFSRITKLSISETLILKRNKYLKIFINSISMPSTLRYAPLPLFCSNASSNSSEKCNMASSAKIYVKGLPQSISEGCLMKVFSEYGEISQVDLPLDRESRQPLGYAFICFDSEASAKLAVEEVNGKFLFGRFIYVTIAKPRSRSQRNEVPYKF